MTDTVNNGIPFVPENTTDPAAGLNLSLLTIDMLLHLAVESIGDTTPPATVIDGARYIVGVGATGAWSGYDNKLAMWIDNPGYWEFRDAYFAYNKSDDTIYIFSTSWAAYATTPSASGESNTASNVGAGIGLFYQKSGVDLEFLSLTAGDNISLSLTTGSDVEISAAVPDTTVMQINTDTSSGYTLVSSDAGKCVETNYASANNLTIPPSSSVAFPVGTSILVRQYGAGQTTITAGSGVTIRNPHATAKIYAQYGAVSLHKRATDEWCIEGDLAES